MGKGGGSAPQPSSQTVTQTNLPEYARPYFENLLERGQTASQVEYQPFGGQRTAPFTPLQQQAFGNVQQMQPSQAVGAGIDITANVAQQAGQYGGYRPLQAQNLYEAPYLQQSRIRTPTVGTSSFTDAGIASGYMSPYMQNVVDVQQREAQRQADIARTQRGAQAASAGAFGGSRQAILEAEAARNLATQKGDIQAQGLQSAYQQAQQAYQTDAQRQLAAQQANQAAALQAQGMGLNQAQALNQARMQAAQLGAQYGLSGLQAAEQSRQFGAGLGLQGLQQQLAAAGQLGALGQTQYGQQMGITSAQQQAGAQQQAQAQQQLDQQYEEFMRQQFYPQSQLQFYSSLLRGVPVAPQQTMYSYQAPASAISQIGGLGLGALGLTKAFGAKEGGEVKAFAEGGVVGADKGSYDAKISEYVKYALAMRNDPRRMEALLSRLGPLEKALVKERVAMTGQQFQNQAAMARGKPQGSVLEGEFEEIPTGVAALDTGALESAQYANGGIVAFQNRGLVEGEEEATSPAGRFFRNYIVDPFRGIVRTREDVERAQALRQLRRQETQARPGIFEPLTPSQEAARLAQVQSAQQGIAALRPSTPTGQVTLPITAQEPEQQAYGPTATRPPVMTPPGGPGAAPVPTAKPAVAAGGERPSVISAVDKALQPSEDELKANEFLRSALNTDLVDPEQRRKDYAARAKEAGFTDKSEEIRNRYLEEARVASEERDKDRWLAVAMGGFAAASADSPYAMKNFAQGLGLTTKELAAVNKDFRKADVERKKAERAEMQANQAMQLDMFNKAEMFQESAERHRLQQQQYQSNAAASLSKTGAANRAMQVETGLAREKMRSQERIAAASTAATKDRFALDRMYADAVRSGDVEKQKEVLEAMRKHTEANYPQRLAAPSKDKNAVELMILKAQADAAKKRGDIQSYNMFMAQLGSDASKVPAYSDEEQKQLTALLDKYK